MLREMVFVAALFLLVAVEGRQRLCEPGSVFKVRCNTCRCSMDGMDMGCTRIECPREYRSPFPAWLRASPLKQRYCQPGSVFKMECNDCKCNDDGTNAACTLRACI